MRLAILSQNARAADAIGGQIAAKVRAARAQGWEVRVYLNEGEQLHPDVAPLAVVGAARSFWRQPEQRRWLRQADVVAVEYGGDFELLDLLPALGRRQQRIIINDYGVTPAELAGELQPGTAQRGYAWLADRVVVQSRFIADELAAATGLPLQRIQVLPCCLPAESAVPAQEARLPRPSAATLLFIGRLATNKRLPVLIEAAARLRELPRQVRVVAVGRCDDRYAAEAERCRRLARDLAVPLDLRGQVSAGELQHLLKQVDVVVQPSVHEGFCLPILEALAAGRPVMAARAGASPATLGAAGLSFAPDDAADLAATLRRVFTETALKSPRRVAIVSPRFGPGFAGGAERSLASMAHALAGVGWDVEVFTTCNEHDHQWRDVLPKGTTRLEGLLVHRFPCDRFDAERLQRACDEIRRREGVVAPAVEADYLENSLGSTALVTALVSRQAEFAAFLAGPYLFRLTWQVATALPRKTLVVPCFHDEPYARLEVLRRAYAHAAGLLFHTAAEQEWTHAVLGLNQPRSAVVGALLPAQAGSGDARRGQERCGQRYLVYCGRWSTEKGCDRLIDFMRHVARDQPGLWRLVVMGGGTEVPCEPWLLNLGFVDEATKRDVLAGAVALVQFSRNESLSLVLLESWAEGVPVVVHADAEVPRSQVERSGGGWWVADAAGFSTLLTRDLADDEERRRRGAAGRAFTREHYQDAQAYAQRLNAVVASVARPVREIMEEVGPNRAAEFREDGWRPKWVAMVEQTKARPRGYRTTVRPPSQVRVPEEGGEVLVPVRVRHEGTATLAAAGPGRHRLWLQLTDETGRPAGPLWHQPLPRPLLPGQEMTIAVAVPVPRRGRRWKLGVRLSRRRPAPAALRCTCLLSRTATDGAEADWQAARAALARAHAQRHLPDDYVDVSDGRFASLKRWVKRKLLNNFRRGYVDVLSRQQSSVNEELINCVCVLLEQMDLLRQQVAELRWQRRTPSKRHRPTRPVRIQGKDVP